MWAIAKIEVFTGHWFVVNTLGTLLTFSIPFPYALEDHLLKTS